MSMVFYLASVVLSLYAAYLFTFRTYKADRNGGPEERLAYPNIVYLLAFAFAFIPIINAVMVIISGVAALICIFNEDIYIDSWLFRKPKEKDNNNKED